ncbi:tobamovirus multiplication protein 1-like isoform X5 [Salvia hispanica]|uniref:tobamovirus multiplication protein 1-like isoform X4 n=1 Tax=Salvia hispanica TaxID=49212 RepID=UPI002009601D|nr:tobamovirus multiplication protein 1-like isoform X4 [Salvia hispanica]XP_047950930.1 tobamovirus multiplication protein 1-like isoform X5 [Salvia hispanica]
MLELRAGRRCYSEAVEGVNVGLAFVDAVIGFVALYKLIRIHSRNTQLGWTRQKVIHLLIGSSNLAFPKILFIAAFLLLLSFWVDLCHHPNDEEEDEDCNPHEPLLEKMNKTSPQTNGNRRCCTFRLPHIGSRQKIVIVVTVLVFAIMIASSVLIWIGMDSSPIESAVVAQVYVDLIAVIVLLLGGALACYGVVLFLKMKKVRSERASSEMWKVAGLAVVSVICFTSSASVAIGTQIPLFYDWDDRHMDGIRTSFLLILYYFIGSSVPSAVILFLMRELPPPLVSNTRREESTTITFMHDCSATAAQRPSWTRATQNQVSRASPI